MESAVSIIDSATIAVVRHSTQPTVQPVQQTGFPILYIVIPGILIAITALAVFYFKFNKARSLEVVESK